MEEITALQMAEYGEYFHGILIKRNPRGKDESRFCVLIDHSLWYFKKQSSRKSVNKLDLLSYEIIHNGVEIILKAPGKEKNYLLFAESQESAMRWIDKMRSSVEDYLKGSQNSFRLRKGSLQEEKERDRMDSGYDSEHLKTPTHQKQIPVSIEENIYVPEEIFMGCFSKDIANMLMNPAETGMYMFYKDRQKTNVLAVKNNNGESFHFKIIHNEKNEFSLHHLEVFHSLLELVLHYRENGLPNTNTKLTMPFHLDEIDEDH